MPYVSCPRCDLVLGARDAYTMESCPRCLAREGERVELEAHLGNPERKGRFLESVRREIATRGSGRRRETS